MKNNSTLIPAESKLLETNVIREGEHTGHSHRFAVGTATLHGLKDQMFMRVPTKSPVTHEEHNRIDILSGEYKVKGVQEFDHLAEEARAVMD